MPMRWRNSFAAEFQLEPKQFHRSGVGRRKAFADFDGGGLAGAIRSQQAEALSAHHLEVETIDSHHVAEGLAQTAERQGMGPW